MMITFIRVCLNSYKSCIIQPKNFKFWKNPLLYKDKYSWLNFKHYKDFSTFGLVPQFQKLTSLNIRSNVKEGNLKDALLYLNSNRSFFKWMNLFCLSQSVFWVYLGHFSYSEMKDCPLSEPNENDPNTKGYFSYFNWRLWNPGKYKKQIALGSVVLATLPILLSATFTRNSIKSLILNKGGQNATLEFFGVFGKGNKAVIPIENLSAQQSRRNATGYLALKHRGKTLFYIIDVSGEFRNKHLFDTTVGLKRTFL